MCIRCALRPGLLARRATLRTCAFLSDEPPRAPAALPANVARLLPNPSLMEIVFTVLILLLAVASSGILIRLLPVKAPLPLVQIAIGALLAWPKLGLHVTFDPGIFMVLFIPPLLFADGWRIPKREFFMQRRAILMLALGLVFMTVLAIGYFVHALVPSISLPVAFALAAVLS